MFVFWHLHNEITYYKIMASLNSIFQIFLPKDKVFFSLFEKSSSNLKIMAQHLKELVLLDDLEAMKAKLIQLEDLEHENDELTHELFVQLGKNFITPFDREDIHYLATSIDDVADYIYASSKKIVTYKVAPHRDVYIQKFIPLIEEGCDVLCKAINGLNSKKDLKEVYKNIVHINSIENLGDDVFDESIINLFDNEIDAKTLIKKKEIYQMLELVTDKFEEAGNVIESILIKYA